MARFVDPLVVGRVIGEVVDLFVPSISMTVAYGPKDISNGCLLKPSATAAPPLVRISGRRNDLYTLIMTDPDAPSPSDPTMREYLHWIVTNIPGGRDASKEDELVEFPDDQEYEEVIEEYEEEIPVPEEDVPEPPPTDLADPVHAQGAV